MSRRWTLAAVVVALAGAALGAWTFWARTPPPRAATTAIACVLLAAGAVNVLATARSRSRSIAGWLTGAGLATYALGLLLVGAPLVARLAMLAGALAFIAGVLVARRRA